MGRWLVGTLAAVGTLVLVYVLSPGLRADLVGLAGVALGVGASTLLPALIADLPAAAFATTQIAMAFGVSALIGALFGSLPAYRSVGDTRPLDSPTEAGRSQPRGYQRMQVGVSTNNDNKIIS